MVNSANQHVVAGPPLAAGRAQSSGAGAVTEWD